MHLYIQMPFKQLQFKGHLLISWLLYLSFLLSSSYIYIYIYIYIYVEKVKREKDMFDGLLIFERISTSIFFFSEWRNIQKKK